MLLQNLSIQSSQKTWSDFTEAYDANARDFGIVTPRFPLPAIMHWLLTYGGPKLDSSKGQEFSQDPLVLAPELSAQPELMCVPHLVGPLATPQGDGPS